MKKNHYDLDNYILVQPRNKNCALCQKVKTIDNTYLKPRAYSKNTEGRLYFASVCMECEYNRSQKWIENNRERFREHNRKSLARAKNRLT